MKPLYGAILAAEWTRRVSASLAACPVNLAKEGFAITSDN